MSRALSSRKLLEMQELIRNSLQDRLLFKGKRRGDQYWWYEDDAIYGVKIFEYSPGILRLTTSYAKDAATRFLSWEHQPKVSRKPMYEISFCYHEAATVVPWALGDIVLAGGRPSWAYAPYWIRHDGGGYFWTLAGWQHAEKQRQRPGVWPYRVPIPQAEVEA